MPLAPVAPVFNVPKGKVVYIALVPTRTNKEAGLQLMENQFGNKVLFMRLDWSSADGKRAAEAYSIEKAPAAVIVDKNGRVVAKTEGALTSQEMKQELKDLVNKSRK